MVQTFLFPPTKITFEAISQPTETHSEPSQTSKMELHHK